MNVKIFSTYINRDYVPYTCMSSLVVCSSLICMRLVIIAPSSPPPLPRPISPPTWFQETVPRVRPTSIPLGVWRPLGEARLSPWHHSNGARGRGYYSRARLWVDPRSHTESEREWEHTIDVHAQCYCDGLVCVHVMCVSSALRTLMCNIPLCAYTVCAVWNQ